MTNIKSSHPTRIEGLDIIRMLAILCVIIIHCVGPIRSIDELNDPTVILHCAAISIGRLGVPFFFLLSGYFLIHRNYDKDRIKKFYKNNFLTLLLTWELWLIIYHSYFAIVHDVPINWSVLLKNLLFIEYINMFHAWYMPVILEIYLILPIMSKFLNALSTGKLIPIAIISYIYLFVMPTAYYFALPFGRLHTLMGVYIFYVVLGYLIRRYENTLKSSILLIFVAIFSIIATTKAQEWISILLNGNGIYDLWYNFCLLPLAAVCIFIYLKDKKCKFFRNLISKISDCSFGIYLIHVLIMDFFWKYGILNFIENERLYTIVFTCLILLISFVIVFLLKKIPHFGKILFR